MRDTLILITQTLNEKKVKKLNDELIRFGKTRGLWCTDGVMMHPSAENINKMLEFMKDKNMKIVLAESKKELANLVDIEMLDEQLKRNSISCLFQKENQVIGLQDDTLLTRQKPRALLVNAKDSDIKEMKAYVKRMGYEIEETMLKTNLNGSLQDEVIKEILEKNIDAVVMPDTDFFNSEDYTTPLVTALYQHGIQAHIAEIGESAFTATVTKRMERDYQNQKKRQLLS